MKTKDLYKISTDNWIVKSNTLNEIRDNKMSPTQLRFFSIYLSKINPKDERTRLVSFKLDDYSRIMQFKRTNITRLQRVAEELLSLTASFKEYKDEKFIGMTVCQIFKRFKLFLDESQEWCVSIDCHDDILPYMFNFRAYFFKYQLWNALKLGTVNQIRMYEILKQYEIAGARRITLEDLRDFLSIGKDEYKTYADFRKRVLDSCQKELERNTDIKFTYEPVRKGKGGKIAALKFFIEHNENYVDQNMDELLYGQNTLVLTEGLEEMEFTKDIDIQDDDIDFYRSACDNRFNKNQIRVLYDIVKKKIQHGSGEMELTQIEIYNYFRNKYNEFILRASETDIKKEFYYFKKMVEE